MFVSLSPYRIASSLHCTLVDSYKPSAVSEHARLKHNNKLELLYRILKALTGSSQAGADSAGQTAVP
jgi:hypothetical protein